MPFKCPFDRQYEILFLETEQIFNKKKKLEGYNSIPSYFLNDLSNDYPRYRVFIGRYLNALDELKIHHTIRLKQFTSHKNYIKKKYILFIK